MVEQFFRNSRTIARLRATALGRGLDELAEYLHARGHSHVTGQDYLRGAAHFGYWIVAEKIAIPEINEEVVARFLRDHAPQCRCPVPRGLPLRQLRASLGHLLKVLRDSGQAPRRGASSKSAAEVILQGYGGHLRDVRGAQESTCIRYTRHVQAFLVARFGTGSVDLSCLTPRDVMSYFHERAAGWRPKTSKLLGSSLRSFFSFMQVNGACDARLAGAVPTIPEWKLARLPKTISNAELRALLGSFPSSAIGRRDRAMCLCLCRLALRASEVALLRLDDIDWRSGILCIGGKSRRESQLPLPADVGRAIAAYLRHGRPQTQTRRVFVRHQLPVGAELGASSVRIAIRRGFERAGLEVVSKGTHVLRHTAATNMIRAGATLKEVADVLRHRSIDTTTIYAKVDLPRLTEVAMPWPEVRS